MRYLILSLMFAFFVQVKIPAGLSRSYNNVQSVEINGFTICLTLEDGKKAYVPALFTVIEEK